MDERTDDLPTFRSGEYLRAEQLNSLVRAIRSLRRRVKSLKAQVNRLRAEREEGPVAPEISPAPELPVSLEATDAALPGWELIPLEANAEGFLRRATRGITLFSLSLHTRLQAPLRAERDPGQTQRLTGALLPAGQQPGKDAQLVLLLKCGPEPYEVTVEVFGADGRLLGTAQWDTERVAQNNRFEGCRLRWRGVAREVRVTGTFLVGVVLPPRGQQDQQGESP